MGQTKQLFSELSMCTCLEGWCNDYCYHIAKQLNEEINQESEDNFGI